ncbi:hypothetical protein FA13DRAFT_1786388 [Coprinellus micaceus]|uniref:F-box domain-containing protein n=1 Tax=Coprinellus micaceus TaxID=71717 RepID=A0A4Y7TUA7_COPMI|nr:hypothetical protein FA13DRAFT_1786388 [Coprinellus micaceus]
MESSPSDGSVGEAGQACRLPREIVRHILLDSLDPFTILSMRRTCKLIYKTSRDKDIWVATLEKVCEEYGIFKPTFPMAQMSLMELEHAATSPQRFLSLIRREPLSTDSDPNGRPYLVENLMLVPGGRYLLCTVQMGDSEGHDIAIWDLGYNSKQYLDPYPVKLIEDRELDSATPSQGGSKLVLATRPSMSAGLLDIYEVDFTSQPPDLSSRSLGHLLMDVDDFYWHVVRLTDNDILVWREPFFIFWDWKSGVGGRWEVSKGLNDNCKPYASKTSIVACATDNSILVWDFPSGSIAALPDQPTVDQLPMSVIWPKFILPLEHNSQVVWMAATPEWQHKSSAELNHHICISVQRHGTQMRLYSVKTTGRYRS